MKIAFGSGALLESIGTATVAALRASGLYYTETHMRWHYSLRSLKVQLGYE